MDEELAYLVLSVVEEIPAGRVATYGQRTVTYGDLARQLAERQGLPHMSAQAVGGAVGHNHISILIPCHRVVDHSGRIAPGWPEQAHLLAQEGVPFRDPTHVDMKRAQWEE